MSLEERIMEDLKAAMKAKDEVAKLTLRSLKADLLKKAVDLGRDLDESDELALLSSAVKSRRDCVKITIFFGMFFGFHLLKWNYMIVGSHLS